MGREQDVIPERLVFMHPHKRNPRLVQLGATLERVRDKLKDTPHAEASERDYLEFCVRDTGEPAAEASIEEWLISRLHPERLSVHLNVSGYSAQAQAIADGLMRGIQDQFRRKPGGDPEAT